jgi:hypothetical protein
MKRLIISGIPCSQQAWLKLFPKEDNVDQRIIPFIDIFEKYYYKNKRFSDLIPSVAEIISEFEPNQIILHDIGVNLGLLAILNAREKKHYLLQTVIIFNGAFRGFDVSKSTHPVRIQSMSYEEFEREVKNNGGEVDPRYRDHYPALQEFYLQIANTSKKQIEEANKDKSRQNFLLQKNVPKIDLGGSALILASHNDPYIHHECLEILNQTLINSQLQWIDYQHFPYSGDIKLLKSKVDKFQTVNSIEPYRARSKL